MRVFLQTKASMSRRYGAAKLLIELADALGDLGVACDIEGPESLGVPREGLSEATAAVLHERWGRYDVVELDYKFTRAADLRALLARRDAEGGPAFVMRCQLWRGHLLTAPPPPLRTARARLARLVNGRRYRKRLERTVARDLELMALADRLVVSNAEDRADLAARGLDPARVAVVRPGLDDATRAALAAAAETPPEDPPVVAFVGTFDERKGGADFPALVTRLAERHPGVRVRLLGTKGRVETAEGVYLAFPRALHDRLEVVPEYAPAALPTLLEGCAAGVFPSYAEGFGYGVLEMLAAGLPVVAYDRPGPPVMLGPERLVPVGRADLLADRVADLLDDPAALAAARAAALARAADFGWAEVARETLALYLAARAEPVAP